MKKKIVNILWNFLNWCCILILKLKFYTDEKIFVKQISTPSSLAEALTTDTFESQSQSLKSMKNKPFESSNTLVESTEPFKTEKQIDKNLEVIF